MKLLVLGANGRTGTHIVEQGLARRHQIVGLVRNASSLPARDGLTVIEGTPTQAEDVTRAAQGCDAILCALNNPRASDAPWSKPLTDEKILTQAAKNMIASGVKRVVFLSSIGVGDSFADTPWIMRFLIKRTHLGVTFADHNSVEEALRASDLDWTLVRPMGLSNANKEKSLVVGTAKQPKHGMMIRRSTVAGFMLDCAEEALHLQGTPVISEV